MPDDLNDQNLSELASSISAHDLNSMSQALTVSVLNSALDINTSVPNSKSSRSEATVARGTRLSELCADSINGSTPALRLPAGIRPGHPMAFPILQGQLLQGQLVASGSAGPFLQGHLAHMSTQRHTSNVLLQNSQRVQIGRAHV